MKIRRWPSAPARRELSGYSFRTLEEIQKAPRPSFSINPGAVAKLLREGLVEIVQLPSPYKMHSGACIGHLKITVLGQDRLRNGKLDPR